MAPGPVGRPLGAVGRRPPKALEAARWLFETQKAQLAEDPTRHRDSIASTRQAADKFGVSKSSVARQLLALKSGKPDARSLNRVGRPSRITDAEEQMLAFHMFMLRREMRPVNLKVVKDAADALLSRRDPPGEPVSGSWVRRWLRANRAQARAEAAKGALPGVEPAGADEEDDDTAIDDDAPDVIGTAALTLPPSVPNTRNPGSEAADMISNLQPLLDSTAAGPSTG